MQCPTCGSDMWDNRAKKASGEFNPKSPDFTCKADRTHVVWPPRGRARRSQASQPVSQYNGDPTFASMPQQTREPVNDFQPGILNTGVVATQKDFIIAREAAGNALGRLLSGSHDITMNTFIDKVDMLADYYVTGAKPGAPRQSTQQAIKEAFGEDIDPDLPF